MFRASCGNVRLIVGRWDQVIRTYFALYNELIRSDAILEMMSESAKTDLQDSCDGGEVVEDETAYDQPVVESGFCAF